MHIQFGVVAWCWFCTFVRGSRETCFLPSPNSTVLTCRWSAAISSDRFLSSRSDSEGGAARVALVPVPVPVAEGVSCCFVSSSCTSGNWGKTHHFLLEFMQRQIRLGKLIFLLYAAKTTSTTTAGKISQSKKRIGLEFLHLSSFPVLAILFASSLFWFSSSFLSVSALGLLLHGHGYRLERPETNALFNLF